MAACCTYHLPTNFFLLLNKSHITTTNYFITKNIGEFSGKKVRRMGQQQKADKTDSATGVGRRAKRK